MLTRGQVNQETAKIKDGITAALTAAGYTPDWSGGCLRVDGHYVSVEINRYGRIDRWNARDALDKVAAGKLSEEDVPSAETIEVITGDYRHSRLRVRRKKDGSIDMQKIVDTIIQTVNARKLGAEAQQERDRKREHALSVVGEVFSFTNEPPYFHFKNGRMDVTHRGTVIAEGALDGFDTNDISMLARAGILTFKLEIDGDKLTTEVVTLLKDRLGEEDDEEAA